MVTKLFKRFRAWINRQTWARIFLLVLSASASIAVFELYHENPLEVTSRLRKQAVDALPAEPARPELGDIPDNYWGGEPIISDPLEWMKRKRFKDSVSSIIDARRNENVLAWRRDVRSAFSVEAPTSAYIIYYVGRAFQMLAGLFLYLILWFRTAKRSPDD